MIRAAVASLIGLAALASCQSSVDTTQRPMLTVFAAASLQPPFDKIVRQAHVDARFNYAGTQTPTAQLTQGAQADVFASADSGHMKTVQDAGLLTGPAKITASRSPLARSTPRAFTLLPTFRALGWSSCSRILQCPQANTPSKPSPRPALP